jgi:NAD(P)-dependent dehydrogenase (short-subunit alcohol dehydrogenase family)
VAVIRGITPEDREACLRVLQQLSEDPSVIAGDERMKALIAKIHRGGKKGERRSARVDRREADNSLRSATPMVQRDLTGRALAEPAEAAAGVGVLHRSGRCYVCKQAYDQIHSFYHLLCPECAAFNYERRQVRADLTGRTAIVTGGRIKIGYQLALRLLRDGARVIVTTRFPRDAERRFSDETDHLLWRDRLRIEAIDLRNIPAVEALARRLAESEDAADILVNNAAQTIKRPVEFYAHLLQDGEAGVLLEGLPHYPAGFAPALTPVTSPSPVRRWFPVGALDPDGQQVDRRPENSWGLRLQDVSTLEMLESHLVNAVAPFILCRELRPLLLRSPWPRRFIVNVSAMEGQFGRQAKNERHPHTNMAKAALNMLTRTCARDFARDGIYVNSVDTGWITDEHPHERRVQRQSAGFFTPLDVIDGAARVYDPIARGVREDAEPPCGLFLKDYRPFPW